MPLHGDEAIKVAHQVFAVDRSLDFNSECGFGELIRNRQGPYHPCIGDLIEREVRRTHMVQELCLETVSGVVEVPRRALLRPETRSGRPSSR